MDWFTSLFINEVKPALDRHSGSGGGSDSDDKMFILLDEDGTEYPAVVVSEETVFDATPNDIREGKKAATESGVTIGTKEIPAYITTEGTAMIRAGKQMIVNPGEKKYDYTKLLAVVCTYNTSLANSVAVEKTCINGYVYPVSSTEALSGVIVDREAKEIDLGLINDTSKPVIIRYITYKEEE